MPIPGALIAAGTSLLSGLFGRSSAKKQAKKEEAAIRAANEKAQEMAAQMNREARARADAAALVPVQTEKAHAESQLSRSSTSGGVDMAGFMAAAKDNGFNPLTFLRSGALSLFAKSDTVSETILEMEDWACTTGERAMDAAIQGQYIPQLSPVISSTKVPGIGEVFGNALTTGANQYLSDLSQQQNNQFQMDLLNRQLAGANQRGAYNGPRSGYIPQAFLTGGSATSAGPGVGGSTPAYNPGGGYTWMPSLGAFVKSGSNLPDNPNEYAQFVDAVDAGTNDFQRVLAAPTRQPDGSWKAAPGSWSRPLSELTTDWLDYYTDGRYRPFRSDLQDWLKYKEPGYQ